MRCLSGKERLAEGVLAAHTRGENVSKEKRPPNEERPQVREETPKRASTAHNGAARAGITSLGQSIKGLVVGKNFNDASASLERDVCESIDPWVCRLMRDTSDL